MLNKKWEDMSDAEKARVRKEEQEKFSRMQPIAASTNVIHAADAAGARKIASAYWNKNYPHGVEVETIIGKVVINIRGIKNSLSHGIGQKKLDAIPTLKEGMKQAAYIGTLQDFDGRPIKNHFFLYKTNFDNEENYVICRIKQSFDRTRFYIHEVAAAKDFVQQKSDSLQTQPANQGYLQLRGIALYEYMITDFLQGVNGGFYPEQKEEKKMQSPQSPLMSREDFLKDKTPGIVLWAERTEFKFDEEWLRNWVEQQPQWESFEHFNMLYSTRDVYDAVNDAEDEGITIKYAPDGKKYLIDYGMDDAFIEESDRIAEYYAEMEKQKASPDNELSADEMEEYHKWLEEEQQNAEMYYQEISDSLTVAEESLDDNAVKELRGIADDLHTSMKNVEEAEQNCGADQETWDGYAPRHENIIRTIEQAGDAKSEGKSDEECSKALLDAQESMREGTAYMQERCELILQREKEYQEQIEGLRRRIEELEREREVKVQSPEELARCLAVSTEFLAAIDAMRKEAKSQPRIVASEMFAASRESVKEAYYSVKLAPTKVKSYLKQKVHKAIDGVLHSVAGVFDKGIAALQQRRDEILKKSHEVQSATEFYRDAMKKETEGGKVQGTMEMERRVASLMAKKGFGVYAIEKVLRAESPYRKEMEQGDAKNIAKDAVQGTKAQREEKTR